MTFRPLVLALLFLVLSATAGAQPLRQGEAFQAWARMDDAARRVLGLPQPKRSVPEPADKPATRAQILAWLDESYEAFRPKFRLTPTPRRVVEGPIRERNPERDLPRLRKLVAAGFVSPVGPLAAGPDDGMSVEAYARALGDFFVRLAELTHRPSREFSPDLMGG